MWLHTPYHHHHNQSIIKGRRKAAGQTNELDRFQISVLVIRIKLIVTCYMSFLVVSVSVLISSFALICQNNNLAYVFLLPGLLCSTGTKADSPTSSFNHNSSLLQVAKIVITFFRNKITIVRRVMEKLMTILLVFSLRFRCGFLWSFF